MVGVVTCVYLIKADRERAQYSDEETATSHKRPRKQSGGASKKRKR